MKRNALGALSLLVALPGAAGAAENIFEDIIVVTGRQPDASVIEVNPGETPLGSADMAAAIARLPGGGLMSNGPLSGQIQYRGATGYRVGTHINNQSIEPGGPNLMDPPMHYAPPTLVDTISVHRGVAPLSFGPSLSGGVNASLKQVGFSDTGNFQPTWDLSLLGRSADDSHAAGLVAGAASRTARFYGFYSDEQGDNRRSPIGDVQSTFHDRQVYGGGVGLISGDVTWGLSLRRHETGATGNPSFPMDINYVDTDFADLTAETTFGNTRVRAALMYSDVDHLMDNHTSRPPPSTPMRYRATRATAESHGFSLDAVTDLHQGQLSWGFDTRQSEHNVQIGNPLNPSFFLNSLPDISQDRTGAYVSWMQSFAGGQLDVGARVDRLDDKADLASVGSAVPMGPTMLASGFNNSNRDWEDTTVDLLARYWRETGLGTWRLSIARKNRAPTYLERFAWLPTPASGGLADGNTYVGSQTLKAETALIVETGIDLTLGIAWVRPSIYYHRVDDYIQGVPFDSTPGVIDSMVEMVSSMNGDPTPLQFNNVDASMYGLDADYGVQLAANWQLTGVLSMVRGERRDINDDLYRITPDRISLGLVYDRSTWSASIEAVGVRHQDRVSATNREQATSGYGLINVAASWQASEQLILSGGIENLADRSFEDHMAGYNRVMDAIVPVGSRLPGTGRNLYIRVSVHSL